MADLTITAANVVPGTGAVKTTGIAGATITAGQVVYQDAADGKYKLADNNSGTAALRNPAGIALHGASNNQPLTVLTRGQITIGATVVVAAGYYLSDTPGGIGPVGDLATGEYPSFLGFAINATTLDINIRQAGVAVP